MQLFGATASHVGNLREANQDRALFRGSVAALADGMGGHQGGERAAELAIGEFRIMQDILTPAELVDVVEEANRQVHKQSVNPDLRGMGTTMVALGLYRGRILVVNVGDSRAYRLRNSQLAQLTVDHSFVEELVRQGRLTPEEAAIHPQRNIVTRALGISPEVEVDQFPVEPEVGDRYLLASDGLFSEVPEQQIRDILGGGADPGTTATALVTAALETPCRDNVTVAVVDVVADGFQTPVGYEPEQHFEPVDQDITAPVPIVAPAVVRITDRPEAMTASDSTTDTLLLEPPDSASSSTEQALGAQSQAPAAGAGHKRYRRKRRLLTIVGSIILLLTTVAVGVFAVNSYGRSSYFVDEVEGELGIYQGRKGGFLWVEPTVAESGSGVEIDQLTESSLTTFENWGEFSSLAQAREAIMSLEVDQLRSASAAGEQTGTTDEPVANQADFDAEDGKTTTTVASGG